MLLLTYVLRHKRAFALLLASYTESNAVLLVDLPVSPGHCCPALVPLKQGINVQQLPGLWTWAAFGLWSSCIAGGYGQEQEECHAGTECHLSGPRLKGYCCYLNSFLTTSHDLLRGAFQGTSKHSQQGWDVRLCPCQRHTVSKDQKFVDALLSLWAIPLLARHTPCWAEQCDDNCSMIWNIRDLQQ